MTSEDECHARFDAAREAFEVEEGQPTENYITKIVEANGGVLYTLRYDVEKGKDNLVGIIIDDPTYVKKFSQSFERPDRPSVYDDSLTDDKVTVKIRKAEAARGRPRSKIGTSTTRLKRNPHASSRTASKMCG